MPSLSAVKVAFSKRMQLLSTVLRLPLLEREFSKSRNPQLRRLRIARASLS
jgi:hypothetical protein